MSWERRLPTGVTVSGKSRSGFTLSVAMPTGDDALQPLVCPVHPEHRFKVEVTQTPGADTSTVHCAYCGHAAPATDFMRDQMRVLETAAVAAAEQMIADEFAKAFGKGLSKGSRGSGVSITMKSGPPPRRRSLPTYEIEQTRRIMTCGRCTATFAVYGLALYCPECGLRAPAQQFRELVRTHRERLDALAALPPEHLCALTDSGALTATYESTIKDGFGALETYLKDRFVAAAPDVKISATLFQRLDEAADLYRDHLGEDIRAAVGDDTWQSLKRSASLRHVLTHSAGKIDQKFLDRNPGWPQTLGQRVNVARRVADGFLGVLQSFSETVIDPGGPAAPAEALEGHEDPKQ